MYRWRRRVPYQNKQQRSAGGLEETLNTVNVLVGARWAAGECFVCCRRSEVRQVHSDSTKKSHWVRPSSAALDLWRHSISHLEAPTLAGHFIRYQLPAAVLVYLKLLLVSVYVHLLNSDLYFFFPINSTPITALAGIGRPLTQLLKSLRLLRSLGGENKVLLWGVTSNLRVTVLFCIFGFSFSCFHYKFFTFQRAHHLS